jgi:hypothetical protein
VGLAETSYDRIEIRWPDGSLQPEHFGGGAVDRAVTLNRGQGTAAPAEGNAAGDSRE